MADDKKEKEPVTATVELSGEYSRIADILAENNEEYPELSTITDDMNAVMEVIARTGGATKSRITDEIPPSVSVGFDAETVIHLLRVLELYDLVQLDGNTWRPGPALSRGE